MLRNSGSRREEVNSYGSWAPEHKLSSCGTQAELLHGMWDLSESGVEPVSPALARGFFTTEPPGKPSLMLKTDLILTGSTQCIILNTLECLL